MAVTITNFAPVTAAPGQKVIITGTGFTGATAVKFGGVDALLFQVQSDTTIWAWPNITGTGTVTVTSPSGTLTVPGFSETQVKVKITDLPQLNRAIAQDDILFIFDNVKKALSQSPASNLPAGSGSGTGNGGNGTTGNIYTALGSPFKVRVDDALQYSYDAPSNTTTITDVRLIGKQDYVVTASDLQTEFEDYNPADGSGNLVYNPTAGSVQIKNYQLTPGRHITIYADGVVTTELQDYILSLKNQIAIYNKILSPFTTTGGVVISWRKAANLIPAGWQECTDFRGKMLLGVDPTDPDFGSVGITGGGKTVTLVKENIPPNPVNFFLDNKGGSSSGTRVLSQHANGSYGTTTIDVGNVGNPFNNLNPFRTVMWIEYVG